MNLPEHAKLSNAARVDMLFRVLHTADERETTTEAVAEGLRDSGVDISAAQVTAVRTSAQANPPEALLAAIATYFRQPTWYLTDPGDAERVINHHVQLNVLRAARDLGVGRARLRGGALDVSDLQALSDALDQARHTTI